MSGHVRNVEADTSLRIKPRPVAANAVSLMLLVNLVAVLYAAFVANALPDYAAYFSSALACVALLLGLGLLRKHFSLGFLASLLPFVITWRVGAISNVDLLEGVGAVTLLCYLAAFGAYARRHWTRGETRGGLGPREWQWTIVRIYFGFDMTGHFAEKLFAGRETFHHMASLFVSFGLSHGALFVILSGLCELGIAIGVGMGLFGRLAGFVGAIYYLVANHFGGHFEDGFTWNNHPVGGWEYPMLMVVFFLGIALSGAGRFSVDGWLVEQPWLPAWVRPLCHVRVEGA